MNASSQNTHDIADVAVIGAGGAGLLAGIAAARDASTEGVEGFILSGEFQGIEEQRRARAVVICTGGMSYPVTGSTGDGYAWARAFGHEVTSLRAALVGMQTEERWPRELQGLA